MRSCVFFILFLLIANKSISQNSIKVQEFEKLSLKNIPVIEQSNLENHGFTRGFDLRKSKIEGHPFLFESFNNKAVFKSNGKLLRIDNINIKLDEGIFVCDFNDDEKLIVLKDVKKARINSETFIKIKEGVFKVVFSNKNFSILKKYYKIVTKPVYNKMSNTLVRPAKLLLKSSFYIKKGDDISDFKLKERNILSLLEESKKRDLKKYAKESKLSFRKEKDLEKILNYYNSL